MRKWGKSNLSEIAGSILFFSLTGSVIFSFVRFIVSPDVLPAMAEYGKVRSDYLLMTTQCALGLIVMALPSVLDRKWRMDIPNFMYILYYVFLFCAIFLGEMLSFYYFVPHWDTILHFFSGAMLGTLGFILIDILNRSRRVRVSLSPMFVALFSFCFALAAGAVWEIYEYLMDGLLNMNMQKFADAQSVAFAGRRALYDTMKDVIVDALSALLVAAIGYGISRKQPSASGTET